MVLAIFIAASSFSQFYAGVAGNYTDYKGDFQKSTAGAHIRAGYSFAEKISADLGFTYHSAIKQSSSVYITNEAGDDGIDVPSEINYKFKTITVSANYKFVGSEETAASFYGRFGLGIVLVSYDEKITGNYDKNTYQFPQDQVEKTNQNGFAINLGLGGDYKLGLPIIFGEAGIALPANKVNDAYVENVIPAHFVFNVGVRVPFGSSND